MPRPIKADREASGNAQTEWASNGNQRDNWGAFYSAMLKDIGSLYEGFSGPVVFVGHAPDTNVSCYLKPNFYVFITS